VCPSLVGCSSGSKKLELGGSCSLNSDCQDGLQCKFGACHKACMKSVDCAAGERCVQVDGIAVCQLAKEQACGANYVCATGLACMKADNTCRNTCSPTVDCLGGQVCTAGFCVEKNESVTGLDGGVAGAEAGVAADGAAGDAATMPFGTDSSAVDVPSMAAADGNTVPVGPSDARGATDGGGLDGFLTGPDLQLPKWDTGAGEVAPASANAVSEPTSARPGEEITVRVVGVGLTSPDKFTLGGVSVSKAQVSGASDVTFAAKLTVPHGINPAVVDLGFTSAGGPVVAAAVLEVTPIAVTIDGLDVNRGTPDNPFRTFTKAVQTAGTGDTITVGAGEFKTGETWPALPDKVTVLGAGVSKTNFVGLTSTSFTFDGDATAKNLSLIDFNQSAGYVRVTKPNTTVSLENFVCPGMVEISKSATRASLTISGKETTVGANAFYGLLISAPYSTTVLKEGTFPGGGKSIGNRAIYIDASAATVPPQKVPEASWNGLSVTRVAPQPPSSNPRWRCQVRVQKRGYSTPAYSTPALPQHRTDRTLPI
jgi:hypothetical protein